MKNGRTMPALIWGGVLLAGALLAPGLARADDITWWVTDPSKPVATAFAAQFERENPGTHVRLQLNPYADLENKVTVALRSGSPPDVLEVQTSWIPSYAATGKLRDVSDAIKANGIDPKDFLPAALRAASDNGKIYGVPYQAEALAILYNRAMFRAAGLDPDKPPQTWPELADAARALTGRGPDGVMRYGIGIAGGGPGGQSNVVYRTLPFIWMNGGDILSADGKSSPLASPQSVEAVQFYTGLFRTLKVSPPSTLENGVLELRRLFAAGTIAMFQATPTDYDVLHQTTKLDMGVMVTPHPPGRQSSALLGGWAFIAPTDAKNQDGAMKLIRFLATREHIGEYTHSFPALQTAMSLPRFADPALDNFKLQLTLARAQPPVSQWIRMTDIFYQHLQEVLIGDSAPEAAMKTAAAEIDKVLK